MPPTVNALSTLNGTSMPVSELRLPHLRAWRVHALLTLPELAEKSVVSRSTIIRAEKGRPVGVLTAERLARALGCTVKQLESEDPA
jgi:transcriptional regulator with XRE-family HTH domain